MTATEDAKRLVIFCMTALVLGTVLLGFTILCALAALRWDEYQSRHDKEKCEAIARNVVAGYPVGVGRYVCIGTKKESP